jgi:uncharacterized protein (UPF0335 family)
MPEGDSSTARCPNCRGEVNVPQTYAQDDRITCRACGTALKVDRSGAATRLHFADLGPLKEALAQNLERIERLEDELSGARGSLGMGVHGLYVGAAYVVYQIVLKDHPLGVGLIVTGLLIALVCAAALELVNFLFLAKHKRIERLTAEIEELRDEGRDLRQKLREATRR